MPREDQYALIRVVGKDKEYLYPIDTPTNTINSLNNFFEDRFSLSKEEVQTAGYFLKQASILHGIPVIEELQKAAKVNTNVVRVPQKTVYEKKASHHKYALKDRYPIDTPQLVKQASQYFDNNWMRFNEDARREYAINVKKQADYFGVPVSDKIEKFASSTFDSNIGYQLQKRAKMAKTAEGKEAYNKLSMFIKKASVDDFISILRALDKKHDLTKYYGNIIDDPTTTVLGKEATDASYGATWEIDGVTYTEEDLKKALSHPDIISLYGAPLISILREPAQFDELPVNDKKAILQYANK